MGWSGESARGAAQSLGDRRDAVSAVKLQVWDPAAEGRGGAGRAAKGGAWAETGGMPPVSFVAPWSADAVQGRRQRHRQRPQVIGHTAGANGRRMGANAVQYGLRAELSGAGRPERELNRPRYRVRMVWGSRHMAAVRTCVRTLGTAEGATEV